MSHFPLVNMANSNDQLDRDAFKQNSRMHRFLLKRLVFDDKNSLNNSKCYRAFTLCLHLVSVLAGRLMHKVHTFGNTSGVFKVVI